MAIPKSYEFYAPILKYINEKDTPITRKEIRETIIAKLSPTEEELNDLLPNGNSRYTNRVDWSITDLKQAELIENTDPGVYQLSGFGREFLKENPDFDLKTFKEKTPFRINRRIKANALDTHEETEEQENNSNIMLETEDYYESVEADILDRLKNLGNSTVEKGTKFEDICLDLLVEMGYGNKQRTGGAGDRGVDGFLTTDRFGFDRIGIQCKCYADGKINDDQITKFAHGLKNVNGLNKGIFITTTDYTPSARKVVDELKDVKIILINGNKLAQYMREYQIGVKVIKTNYVYDITINE